MFDLLGQFGDINVFRSSVEEFEKRCEKYRHVMCKICRITRMDFTGSTDRNYPVCSECKERFNKWKRIDVSFFSLKDTGDREFRAIMEEFRIDFAKNLPVWYRKDDCNKRDPQYHLPEELIGLSVGEEMLIQRYSTYVPVVRYNKGQLGCKGHVCCFPQDGDDVFMELPRLPKSVNIVHVVKHYKGDNNEKNPSCLLYERKKYWMHYIG